MGQKYVDIEGDLYDTLSAGHILNMNTGNLLILFNAVPVTDSFLLMESGDFLLMESGDKIVLDGV